MNREQDAPAMTAAGPPAARTVKVSIGTAHRALPAHWPRALAVGALAVGALALGPFAAGFAQDDTSARAAAPVDLTGNWVSVISEDWAWRMRTPPKGDYASVPLNDAGLAVADQWDEADDGSCLAYGAATMLRMPTRAKIAWADDDTLEIQTDNGMQLRWLHFAPEPLDDNVRMLQGHTRARWVTTDSVTASGATGGILTSRLERAPWASLEAVTTNLQAAWLRPNGVPVSSDATLTEYFDWFDDGEDEWFTVTTIVDDPAYLTEPFVISSNFRREPDDSQWHPRPCNP